MNLINKMSRNYRCVRFVNLSMSSLGVFSDECSTFLDMMNDIGIDKKQQRYISVLTRILPWGVPGPPLLRNRGPVRTLGGQSYKKHAVRRTWARTPNCLLHEVPTWSNMAEEVFTIRRRSLRCSGTCVGPMKVKATKLKTLTHLISCFLFIQTNRML